MSFAPVARRPGGSAERRRGALLVLPAVLITIVVVGGGIGASLAQSLGMLPIVGPPTPGIDAYLARPGDLVSATTVSLAVAAAATVVATVVGTTAAVAVVSGRLGARVIAALGAASVTVPHLIGAATIGLLLSDAGVLPRLLGIAPESWPPWVGGPLWGAVIAEFAWKGSAFVALVVTGTLATRVAQYDETAALLGAGRWRRFRHVLLPLTAPSIVICATINFVFALGSYEVSWLLGRTHPEPLPVLAVRLAQGVSLASRPEAAAVAVITCIISLAVVAGAFAALRRTAAWR